MKREKQAFKNRLSLRAARAEDEAFLVAVYAATRREELTPFGWSDRQIEDFCRMQFAWQTQAYRMQFPEAIDSVVELDDQAIGRLLVNRGDNEIRLVDVAIMPEFRRCGAGTILVENLQSEAEAANRLLELRVLTTNAAAIRLYERLGFSVAEKNQTHLTMRWRGNDNRPSDNLNKSKE